MPHASSTDTEDLSPRDVAVGGLSCAGLGLVFAFVPFMWWLGILLGLIGIISAGNGARRGATGLGGLGVLAGLLACVLSLVAIGDGDDPAPAPVSAPASSSPTTSVSPGQNTRTPGTGSSTPASQDQDTPKKRATSGNQDSDKTKQKQEQKQQNSDGGRQTLRVTRVIDGDTFEARGIGQGPVPNTVVDVRMLEINTVEQGTCGYEAATDKLAALLGDRITVERDQELKDQYGRYLLYAWSGGTFVNHEMVETGYAEAKLYDPNDKYWDRISAADTSDTYTPWAPCNTPEQENQPPPPQQEEDDDSGGGYVVPAPPPDKDCGGISAENFQVRPGDPHRLDADGDGLGCE